MEAETSEDIDYYGVGLLSVAHFANDLYGNLMTSLTPYLVLKGDITVTAAGLVLLVYLIGSSVLQPVFGYLSDRSGRRTFVVLGPVWVGAAAALFGWASGSPLLLTLAAVGGIGTAAFHPQAASMVSALGSRRRGWTMSLFSMGGNIGFALGPLVAAGIAGVGVHWSAIVVIPGVALSCVMAVYIPKARSGPETEEKLDAVPMRSQRGPLSLVVAVIAIRSAVQYGLIIFLPLYFHYRGYGTELGSYFAFALSLAGAVGALVGGRLSDVYGRRVVVVGSLFASAPAIALGVLIPPPFSWPVIIVAGVLLLASNSVTVVQGQELLPRSTGIASGLTLGLGFGLSGVITSALTTLSDHTGVTAAIFTLPGLALLAGAVATLMSDSHPLAASSTRLGATAGVISGR